MMVYSYAALLLILLQFICYVHGGGSCSCKCSSSRNIDSDLPQPGALDFLHDSRIFAGKYTVAGSRPFQVGLYINDGYLCGGSIYNSITILTAAHCFTLSRGTASNTRVFVGTLTNPTKLVSENAKFEKAVDVIIHPNYDTRFKGYDVAVIRLAAPLKFNSRIQPLGLVTPGVDLTGKVGVVSGWGATNSAMALAPALKEAAGTILTRKECERRIKAFPRPMTVPVGPKGQPLYKSLCVQARKADGPAGQGSCAGDSGGPLTCEVGGVTKLCGLCHSGFGCDIDIPQIYTEVNDPVIFNWIMANVWKP